MPCSVEQSEIAIWRPAWHRVESLPYRAVSPQKSSILRRATAQRSMASSRYLAGDKRHKHKSQRSTIYFPVTAAQASVAQQGRNACHQCSTPLRQVDLPTPSVIQTRSRQLTEKWRSKIFQACPVIRVRDEAPRRNRDAAEYNKRMSYDATWQVICQMKRHVVAMEALCLL